MEESLKKDLKIKSKDPVKAKIKASSTVAQKSSAKKSGPKADTSFFAKSLAKEKWGQIQTDMSKAINYWEDVAKKYEGKPNHDDKQMHEIKRLLQDLQKKLKTFG